MFNFLNFSSLCTKNDISFEVSPWWKLEEKQSTSNLLLYVLSIAKSLSIVLLFSYRYAESRIFFNETKPEQMYGVFAKIVLVEKEPCNLSLDTCSKFDPFLRRLPLGPKIYMDKENYDFGYKRQGENNFLFNNPTCIRRCF